MRTEGAPLSIFRPLLARCMGIVALSLVACGSADEPPLGGPYGGVTGTVEPTDGSVPARPRVNDPLSGQSPDGTDSDSGTTPTFTQIFETYLAAKTVGNCTHCHTQMDSASNSYVWLKASGYISAPSPLLLDPDNSCLSWYGGTMPPGGPTTNARAVKDMNRWAAAGAKND